MEKTLIDIKVDGHVHTALCRHAKGNMEEYVLAGIERGLSGLVFLEHLECGIGYFERTWLTPQDFVVYRSEINRLREKYEGKIDLFCGVEVGYNPAEIGWINDFLGAGSWDRIGISYHFLRVKGQHINLFSRKQRNLDVIREIGVERVLEGYYEGLLEAVGCLDGHVVCHLDGALRHLGRLDNDVTRRQAGLVLERVAGCGMALEINTSGYGIRGEQFPATDLLHQAISLGIPLWPGSDAHRPEDVGRFFDRLAGPNCQLWNQAIWTRKGMECNSRES